MSLNLTRLLCILGLFVCSAILSAQQPSSALTILHTLEGHKELVYSVSFSPDGKHLISGAFDKALKLWDMTTAKEVKTYAGATGHQDLVLTTAFSPDGRIIASGGKDNTIKLWDLPVSGAFREFPGSTGPVSAAAITPDGSKLVTGQADGSLRFWNTADGKILSEVKGNGQAIHALAVSANGQWLAAGDAVGHVQILQISDAKVIGQLTAHQGAAKGLVFHPNNLLLFSTGQDGLLKAWTIPLGVSTPGYKFDKTTASLAARTVDGRVAVACADKTIRVFKSDGSLEKALPAAAAEIKCLSLVNQTVIAGLADGKIAWFDLGTGQLVHQVDASPGKAPFSISLRSDAKEFAVSLADGTIKIGEVTADKSRTVDKVITRTLPNMGQTVVQYHPSDVNVLAIADSRKNLITWLIKENKADKTVVLDLPATSLNWNKDASRLAATTGNQLVLVQPKEGKIITKMKHGSQVLACSFGTEPSRVISVTEDGQAHLVDVGNGKIWQSFSGKYLVAGPHSDGKKLVLLGKELVTTSPVSISRLIVAHAAAIQGMSLLDGGNRIATCAADGSAKVFNLTNGNMEREWKGPGPWQAVAATANSQLLFAAADKVIKVYTAADGKEQKTLTLPGKVLTMAVQGNQLMVGGEDGTISVLGIPFTPGQAPGETFGKVQHSFKQPGAIHAIAIPTGASLFYTASPDKSVKSWKIAGDAPQRNLAGHGNLVDAVVYSPDGLTLASCSHDGTVRFWNASDGKQTGEVKLNPQPLYCLAWRPDGKQLAIGSFDRSIRLIDVAGRKVEREIKGFDEKSAPNGHSDAVYSVVYSSNEQLCSAGADGKIKVWKVADGGQVSSLVDPAIKDKAQRDFINTLRLTKDGKKLVAVGNGGWITIWNRADSKMLYSQKLPVGLYGLAISPDDTRIVTGNMNGTLYVIKMP